MERHGKYPIEFYKTSDSCYVFFTPAGMPIVLPRDVKDMYFSSRFHYVTQGALVSFNTETDTYLALYILKNGRHYFLGYQNSANKTYYIDEKSKFLGDGDAVTIGYNSWTNVNISQVFYSELPDSIKQSVETDTSYTGAGYCYLDAFSGYTTVPISHSIRVIDSLNDFKSELANKFYLLHHDRRFQPDTYDGSDYAYNEYETEYILSLISHICKNIDKIISKDQLVSDNLENYLNTIFPLKLQTTIYPLDELAKIDKSQWWNNKKLYEKADSLLSAYLDDIEEFDKKILSCTDGVQLVNLFHMRERYSVPQLTMELRHHILKSMSTPQFSEDIRKVYLSFYGAFACNNGQDNSGDVEGMISKVLDDAESYLLDYCFRDLTDSEQNELLSFLQNDDLLRKVIYKLEPESLAAFVNDLYTILINTHKEDALRKLISYKYDNTVKHALWTDCVSFASNEPLLTTWNTSWESDLTLDFSKVFSNVFHSTPANTWSKVDPYEFIILEFDDEFMGIPKNTVVPIPAFYLYWLVNEKNEQIIRTTITCIIAVYSLSGSLKSLVSDFSISNLGGKSLLIANFAFDLASFSSAFEILNFFDRFGETGKNIKQGISTYCLYKDLIDVPVSFLNKNRLTKPEYRTTPSEAEMLSEMMDSYIAELKVEWDIFAAKADSTLSEDEKILSKEIGQFLNEEIK